MSYLKVLITGDEGFVGKATIDELHAKHPDWISYDLMNGQDIRDLAQLSKFVETHKPNRILHLAAIARFSDSDANPMLAHETNVIGTMNVAMVARVNHIPVVYASTGSVYMPIKQKPPITEDFQACGNSVYGCTKHLGELYIKHSNAPYIILRYAHLYGHEKRMHGLIGGFLDRIKRGIAPTLYGGRQSNDFTYIKDVAKANILALEASWDKWHQIYNIGTGEEISAEHAGKLVCDVWGYKGKIDMQEQRTVDPDRFVFDCSKAEKMLGFKAEYDFKAGLEDMKANEGTPKHESLAPRTIRLA